MTHDTKNDFKSHRIYCISSTSHHQRFNFHVCVSQKTQPWYCASIKQISTVKITWCVEFVKILISVIRTISGWFRQKISTKNLTFSYSRLRSLRCASNPCGVLHYPRRLLFVRLLNHRRSVVLEWWTLKIVSEFFLHLSFFVFFVIFV